MESEKLSDDDYWVSSSQKGFDFGDDWKSHSGSSKLSTSIRRNDNLNQYDLLKCDGLNEIAENKVSSEDPLSFNALHLDEDKHAQKFARSNNPLDIRLKGNFGRQQLSASQTVCNMILGQEYNLKSFKGKDQKLELLKTAVETHDGNAILAVTLFLKSTLKKSLFQREIVKFPDAVNVYLSYLHEDHETDELANMLLLLNKPEEAAMFKYDAATTAQVPSRKLKLIENCLNTHFQPGSVPSFLRESVLEHKLCIQDQVALEEHQISSEVNEVHTSVLFEELTGRKTLIDSSALCSLIFSCLYFYNVAQIAFISPTSVKSRYKLSQKQFTWSALRVLVGMQRWPEIDELFLTKRWLGGMKMRSCIGFTRILEVLAKAKAPPEVMEKYVGYLDKQDMKLFCAKKYKCHSAVIEILKKNRDRKALIEYKATLPPHSIEFCTATAVLNQGVVNWRN